MNANLESVACLALILSSNASGFGDFATKEAVLSTMDLISGGGRMMAGVSIAGAVVAGIGSSIVGSMSFPSWLVGRQRGEDALCLEPFRSGTMDNDYESILFICRIVHIYKVRGYPQAEPSHPPRLSSPPRSRHQIPPRTAAQGYRAADW